MSDKCQRCGGELGGAINHLSDEKEALFPCKCNGTGESEAKGVELAQNKIDKWEKLKATELTNDEKDVIDFALIEYNHTPIDEEYLFETMGKILTNRLASQKTALKEAVIKAIKKWFFSDKKYKTKEDATAEFTKLIADVFGEEAG